VAFTVVCLVGMAVLYRFSGTSERYWIVLAVLLTIAAMLGFQVGMIGMVVAIGVWKVFKDICIGVK